MGFPSLAQIGALPLLRISGEADLLLIHDHRLWQLLDDWVCGLADEPFTQLVPLLRRTFSSLSAAARRQLGERVYATSGGGSAPPQEQPGLDPARGERVVARLAHLTGLS